MALQVASDPPGADVLLHTPSGAQAIGKTPVTIPSDKLSYLNNGFTVEVAKEGYFQQKILVEKRAMSSSGEIVAKLAPHPKFDFKTGDTDVKAVIEEIARQVSTIQSSLLKREFAQAETLSKSLLARYPHLAVGWNLLGNAYFLQGRSDEAADHYRKALELEPGNQETRDILSRMNRAPAEKEK